MNPNHPLSKKVVRHEIEHGVQNALRQSKINKVIDGTPAEKLKALESTTTEIDDILSGLTLRKEGTPDKKWIGKVVSDKPVQIDDYKALINNRQNATDYFLTGSAGAEKSAFLGEVQQYMMDTGKIPKNSYVQITPEMVKETMIDAMFDETGGGKYLRLFNIIKADPKNYELISKGLNKMLSITPLIGVGALQQKQLGGKIYDNNGYLTTNLHNFTPSKVINSNHITTKNMAFPIYANGYKLYPNTGDYIFPTNKVVETPMFQKGGSFKENFRKARINNKESFEFKGKLYSTDLKKENIPIVKPLVQNPYAYTNRPIIENTNPNKRQPIVQSIMVDSKTGLPMTQERANMILAAQKYQNPDKITKTIPKTTTQKIVSVISNPMTSARQLINKQPVTGRGPRNTYDYALDIVNPVTYAKAIKNTASNIVHPIETTKKLVNTGLGILGTIVGDNQTQPIMPGIQVTLDGLMTAQALKSINYIANSVPRNIRDIKYNNTFTNKNGLTFKNSKDFFKQHDGKPLTVKERDFLNNELKQRGILEVQRSNVLNPLPKIFKKGVVAEDYNIPKVVKDFIPNLIKGQKYVDNQYTMGKTRINALNNWLGLPTENTAYRIHSNSFKNNKGLIYTIPEKNINYNNPNLSKFNKQQLDNINSIENYYRNPTLRNKKSSL